MENSYSHKDLKLQIEKSSSSRQMTIPLRKANKDSLNRSEPTRHEHVILARREFSGLSQEQRVSLGRMTTNEADQKMVVTFSTYKRYIFEYLGGCKFIVLSNIAILAFT